MTYLASFREAFHLHPEVDLRNVQAAVEAICEANVRGVSYLAEIDPATPSDGLRIHALINLLGRVFEHAQAMLVAVATGSPASSEALARIVVEGSVNVTYLAVRGSAATLVRFFRTWLEEHDRKLIEWRNRIAHEAYAARVSLMIDERRQLVAGLSNYVDLVEDQCSLLGASQVPEWPKSLFKRFEALGRQTDYYESYHRLSGSSHLTGEDTLIWLASLEMPDAHKHQIAVEARAYSTMMSRIASGFFVDAVAACVIAYGRTDNEDLRACKSALSKAVAEIAPQAGVPGLNQSAG